jgi:hypothetical protein
LSFLGRLIQTTSVFTTSATVFFQNSRKKYLNIIFNASNLTRKIDVNDANSYQHLLEAEDSEVPDNVLIELVLRDIGLECIPKHATRLQKYYMG